MAGVQEEAARDLGGAAGAVVRGAPGFAAHWDVDALAAGAVAAFADQVAALLGAAGHAAAARVDGPLVAGWFASALRPAGWSPPSPWDPVAGDYRAADGWIRLHTNAPHHRAAALRVLGTAADRDAVAARVGTWAADELEQAVVTAGGAAAAMRDAAAWARHPQGAAVRAEPLVARERTGDGPSAWRPDAARPLAGVRVLDLTRVLAGPVATRALALLGATVLRIDPPGWDEPGIVPDMTLGKRAAPLDARTRDGRDRLAALLAEADVLVHGYRRGALDGLGLDGAARERIRPGLVEVALTAYGSVGPWTGRRGFDSLVQMSAGIAARGMRASDAERPVPLPVQALDHATGWLMAAAAVAGLRDRLQDGRGSRARLSLARTAAALHPAEPPSNPGAEADLPTNDETLHTPWGPARVLRPPLSVEGATLRFTEGPAPLGSAEAAWLRPPHP